VFKCIWSFFALNFHVEIGKTIRLSIRSERFEIFTIWEGLLAALRGKYIFE